MKVLIVNNIYQLPTDNIHNGIQAEKYCVSGKLILLSQKNITLIITIECNQTELSK